MIPQAIQIGHLLLSDDLLDLVSLGDLLDDIVAYCEEVLKDVSQLSLTMEQAVFQDELEWLRDIPRQAITRLDGFDYYIGTVLPPMELDKSWKSDSF